MHYFLANIKA